MCNIFFSTDNHNEDAALITLTATPSPVTDINYLRNDEAAEVVKFVNPEGLIVIEGCSDDPVYASYLAILDNNLKATATTRLQLFYDKDDATDYYDTDSLPVGEVKPWGAHRYGIDTWGTSDNEPLNSLRTIWFDELKKIGKWRLTIDPALAYVAPTESTTTTAAVITSVDTSDGIFRQDDSGVLCFEAESSLSITEVGLDTWVKTADSGASNGFALYKSENVQYATAETGPTFTFPFTASKSGNHDVWMRLRSDEGDTFYCVVDGQAQWVKFDMNMPYLWIKARTCTLVAEQQHVLSIAGRDHFIYIDKIVVQTAGSAEPTGTGPTESGTGITTVTTVTNGTTETVYSTSSSEAVWFRKIMFGNTLTLQKNISYGSAISFLTPPELHEMHDGSFNETRPQREAKRLTIDLAKMPEMDYYNLRKMIVDRKGKPFLTSALPWESEWLADSYTLFARIANMQEFTHKRGNVRATKLELVEA